jgi:hypothetical protein
MASEIVLYYPTATPLTYPQFAIFAGSLMWNGTIFVAQTDNTAWQAACFNTLSSISTTNGVNNVWGTNPFTGFYTGGMPGTIDQTQTYMIRFYNSGSTPVPMSELPVVQTWVPNLAAITSVGVGTQINSL